MLFGAAWDLWPQYLGLPQGKIIAEAAVLPVLLTDPGSHLVGLQQHEDHAGRSVAPVHQQVALVAHAGRVVTQREAQTAHVVHAWLDQLMHMLLVGHQARLQ